MFHHCKRLGTYQSFNILGVRTPENLVDFAGVCVVSLSAMSNRSAACEIVGVLYGLGTVRPAVEEGMAALAAFPSRLVLGAPVTYKETPIGIVQTQSTHCDSVVMLATQGY